MERQRAKVSFHIASIPKPQDVYKILVNNANQPFEHVWLQRTEDGSGFIHPLEQFSVINFVDKNVSNIMPVTPGPVEGTPVKLVQDVRDLKELAAKLHDANEFAVDLEHNQYRSFQGLTCLMQISTRTEDYIVDTLKLRVQIGPYLREAFKDPTKRKVMHGADKDILWLQRDFGIYVCNMFDTGQASRVLQMERNSLEHLLQYFCGVAANKEYQSADWRLRPLPDDMLRYAREDTHYLLHIYDLMRIRLLSWSMNPYFPEALLVEVYQRSYDVCKQLYQKDILTKYSYLNIYGLHAANLNGQQLAVLAGLYEWRDIIGRMEDESTGYVLPNKSLIEIAKQTPVTTGELLRLLRFKHPCIERHLGSVVSVIRRSMQDAAAFEYIAKRLKEEHLEMEAARIARRMSEEASIRLAGAAGARSCSSGPAVFLATRSDNVVGNFIAGVNRNNRAEGCSGRGYVALQGVRASVQVQKNSGRGFGPSLGNAAGNRKSDLSEKATVETTVRQIKPATKLLFGSFTVGPELLPPAMKEPGKAQESRNPKEAPSTTSSKPERGIILPESDSIVAEEKQGSRAASSSQKCLQTSNEKKQEGGEGSSEVRPCSCAVAGKGLMFGEIVVTEEAEEVHIKKSARGRKPGEGVTSGQVGGAKLLWQLGIEVRPPVNSDQEKSMLVMC